MVILDGGMGRQLQRIGAPFRQPEWSALALHESPAHVVQAHSDFINAGAQVITTNSYAVVPFHIGEALFREQGAALLALAGRLACEARDATAKDVKIAAGVPLQCDEPDGFRTFRLGLFGLDKLHNIERSANSLEQALDQIL